VADTSTQQQISLPIGDGLTSEVQEPMPQWAQNMDAMLASAAMEFGPIIFILMIMLHLRGMNKAKTKRIAVAVGQTPAGDAAAVEAEAPEPANPQTSENSQEVA